MTLFSYLTYLPKKAVAITVAALVAITITSATVAGFGPDRPTIAYAPGIYGFDHVTFNSYTGTSTLGDERDFLRGAVVGRDSTFSDPVTGVSDGDIVKLYLYVHNGANPSLNASGVGVARDLTVSVDLPSGVSNSHDLTGYISASNASPVEIYDTATITGNDNFSVEFVPGSATITTNSLSGVALSDDIVNGGVLIGDDALDGYMNGCFEYSGWVTLKVKINKHVEPNPEFNMKKEVRKAGTTSWSDNVSAMPGDHLEYRVVINNTGDTEVADVQVKDSLPLGIVYTPGSTTIDGIQVGDTITVAGLAISSISAGDTDTIRYDAIVDPIEFECDIHSLTNTVVVDPLDLKSQQDSATVIANFGDCEPPVFEYDCELLATIVDMDARKVKAELTASHSDNVTVTGYNIDFGDGASVNESVAAHAYANDGSYNLVGTVTFDVGGESKTAECTASITIDVEVEVCDIPGKGHLPADDPNCKPDEVKKCEVAGKTHLDADDPNCKPTELPNTGPGSVLTALFGTGTVTASVHHWMTSRRTLKRSQLEA